MAPVLFIVILAGLLVYGRYPWWLCAGAAIAPALVLPLRLRVEEAAAVWLRRGCFLLYPLVAFLLVEIQNKNNPFTSFPPLYLVLNLAFYYLAAMVLYLVSGRAKLSACAALVFFWGLGLVNRYVLTFRGRSIVPADLFSLRTAANVAAGYDYTPSAAQLGGGVVCLFLILLALTIPPQRGRARLRLRSALPAGLAAIAFLGVFFFSSFLPDRNIRTSYWDTQSQGFVLQFAVSLRYSSVSRPEGYSQKALRDIQASLPDAVPVLGGADGTTTPANVIVIMNEAFSDLSVLGGLETNQDALPFLHSLTENTVKGSAYVSVFGGNTANSEYEFLTGHTTAFLPTGTVPYQMYVKDGAASLVAQMNALGYRTIAMHPFYSSGWNRVPVYNNFGFDQVLFHDSYRDVSYMRAFVDDRSNYQNLIRLYEEKEPGEKLFFFNVTMQNHSSYDLEWINLPREVWLTGEMEGKYPTVDQYLSLMYQSDRALEELLDYFSQVEEPTVVVMFGDHQPMVQTGFYEEMLGPDADSDPAAVQKKQAVPFLIWANYDIQARSGVELSLNYLSALLMETAGLPMTDYQRLLLETWKAAPVVNAVGYRDGEGTWSFDREELSQQSRQALLNYQMFQYNELFETPWGRLKDLFFLKE